MNQKNNWLANCLGFTNKTYITPAGNGQAIPQHKLDKDGKMTTKKDENGKVLTTNLYMQIQAAKSSTDYKKLIDDLGMDLEKINLVLKNRNGDSYDYYKDFTNFGGIETLKSMENKIVNKFGSIDNFKKFTEKKFNEFSTQLNQQKRLWEKYKKEKEIKNIIKKEKEIK